METVDWYFDFVSPYSYLQCERVANFRQARERPGAHGQRYIPDSNIEVRTREQKSDSNQEQPGRCDIGADACPVRQDENAHEHLDNAHCVHQ